LQSESSSDDKDLDNTASDDEASSAGDGCNDDFRKKDVTLQSNVDDTSKNIPGIYQLSTY